MGVKGYKLVNKDYTAKFNQFKYTVGETYEIEGELKLCSNGFHFCEDPFNCFKYFSATTSPIMLEIEALGDVVTDGIKSATSKIKIVREVPLVELHNELENVGAGNSGICNIGMSNNGAYNCGLDNKGEDNYGDHNDGRYNTGDYNEGGRNIGHTNKGFRNCGKSNNGSDNIGSANKGEWNIGISNIGKENIGTFNIGKNNIGVWNAGDDVIGAFSTKSRKIWLFNQPILMQDYIYIMHTYVDLLNLAKSVLINKTEYTDEVKKQLSEIPYFDEKVFMELMEKFHEVSDDLPNNIWGDVGV